MSTIKICNGQKKKFAMTSHFDILLSSGIFPNILKTTKITRIHKKDSKLKCSNYQPIPFYQILIKSFKNHV